MGESRFETMLDASAPLDDSGFETPSKRARVESGVTPMPPPLITEIERRYESLYLCLPGSLQRSYDLGLPPPRKDSPAKMVSALAITPGRTRSINAQLDRVDNYRNYGLTSYPLVDLTNE